jgi:hypothetical protein
LPIGIFFFNTGQYNSQEQHARVCCTRWWWWWNSASFWYGMYNEIKCLTYASEML